MKKILDTLYVAAPEVMKVDDEHIVISFDDEEVWREPIEGLEAIYYFGYHSIRPKLMNVCAEHNVRISIFHPDGQLMSNITSGESDDGLRLIQKQHYLADGTQAQLMIARHIIGAKIFNSRWLIGRIHYQYQDQIDLSYIKKTQKILKDMLDETMKVKSMEPLYDFRKRASAETYATFGDLILREKDFFWFKGRSTKLPMNPVNILLSLAYGLVQEKCEAAVHALGLDPYKGFFHIDKPDRKSLVLDLLEEFKAAFADRFIIELINEGKVSSSDFTTDDIGSPILTEAGMASILEHWQDFCDETTLHTFVEEDIEWGLLPFTSATLLAKFLKDKVDKYPPFFRQDPPSKRGKR